jgi:hypothetical protein
MKKIQMIQSIVWAGLVLGGPLAAAPKPMPNPDFTKGGAIPEGADKDWNLGATGARGWMHSDRLATTQARQIYITRVAAGSPGSGLLEVGDVLLGVAGKPFSHDPRQELGKALSAAEASTGKLALTRWRDGKTDQVTLGLPVLGSYSATAPYDCGKSKRILAQSCAALARRIQQPDYKENAISRSLNALGLLASGDPQYLPIIKNEAAWAADFSTDGFAVWWYGYVSVFLAEYVMATGDKSVLPGLRRIALEAAKGQSRVGSWGHRFAGPDGRLFGYGMMNSPGAVLTLGLVLAREAGVDDPEVATAIKRSGNLLRFYIGKGAVPYGDHGPFMQSHEDNGKCGMAAVLFDQLGEKEGTEFFAKMSTAAHGSERDMRAHRQFLQHGMGDARGVALRPSRDGCMDGGVRRLVFRSRPQLGLELPPPGAAASPRGLVWQVGRDRCLPARLCDATQGGPAHRQQTVRYPGPWMRRRPARWCATAAGSTATAHSPPMMNCLPTP